MAYEYFRAMLICWLRAVRRSSRHKLDVWPFVSRMRHRTMADVSWGTSL